MSLRVWLPLTKDLRNQGLDNVTITNNGATFDSAGKLGGCYNFNGSNNKIEIANAPNSTDISVAMWFKRGATTNTRQFLYTQWNGITLELDADNTVTCSVHTTDGQVGYCRTTEAITVDSGWTHIVYTFKNGVGTSLYLNGSLITSTQVTNLITWSTTTGNIGYFNTYFNGAINDFRIYDHALSQMEVKELSKGLVLHYPLNRGGWGNENLLAYNSECIDEIGLTNDNFSITTEDEIECAHASGALQTTARLLTKVGFIPQPNEYFTISAWIKIKNIVHGTTNAMCQFYFSGQTIDGTWRAVNYIQFMVDGQEVSKASIWLDHADSFNLNNAGWHFVSATVQYQNYNFTSILYPGIYFRDCTGDMYIHHFKLERGKKATPWSPHNEDVLADTLNLNSSIEYDCSGFRHNLNKLGVFTYTSDTPKYNVSTIFNGTETMYGETPNAEILTLACWAKTTENGVCQCMVADSNSKLCIAFDEDGNIITHFGTADDLPTAGSIVLLNEAYKSNDWNHFIITCSSSSYIHEFYCNGIKQTIQYGKTAFLQTTNGFYIGSRNYDGLDSFCGELCDVRAYATKFSDEDAISLYQNSAYIDSFGNVYGAVHSEV